MTPPGSEDPAAFLIANGFACTGPSPVTQWRGHFGFRTDAHPNGPLRTVVCDQNGNIWEKNGLVLHDELAALGFIPA